MLSRRCLLVARRGCSALGRHNYPVVMHASRWLSSTETPTETTIYESSRWHSTPTETPTTETPKTTVLVPAPLEMDSLALAAIDDEGWHWVPPPRSDRGNQKRKRRITDIKIDKEALSKKEREEAEEAREAELQAELLYEPLSIASVCDALRDEGGMEINAIDLLPGNFVQSMVFATGKSGSHLRAMSFCLLQEMKKRRIGDRVNVGGKSTDEEWICVDCGSFCVQLMLEDKRAEMMLEAKWDRNSPGDPLYEPPDRLPHFTRRPTRRGNLTKTRPLTLPGVVSSEEN